MNEQSTDRPGIDISPFPRDDEDGKMINTLLSEINEVLSVTSAAVIRSSRIHFKGIINHLHDRMGTEPHFKPYFGGVANPLDLLTELLSNDTPIFLFTTKLAAIKDIMNTYKAIINQTILISGLQFALRETKKKLFEAQKQQKLVGPADVHLIVYSIDQMLAIENVEKFGVRTSNAAYYSEVLSNIVSQMNNITLVRSVMTAMKNNPQPILAEMINGSCHVTDYPTLLTSLKNILRGYLSVIEIYQLGFSFYSYFLFHLLFFYFCFFHPKSRIPIGCFILLLNCQIMLRPCPQESFPSDHTDLVLRQVVTKNWPMKLRLWLGWVTK
jgi:hypothetical protein